MLKKSHEFDFTLVGLAPDFAQVLFAHLSALIYENRAPEMLDKGITEKIVAKTTVVFFENARE